MRRECQLVARQYEILLKSYLYNTDELVTYPYDIPTVDISNGQINSSVLQKYCFYVLWMTYELTLLLLTHWCGWLTISFVCHKPCFYLLLSRPYGIGMLLSYTYALVSHPYEIESALLAYDWASKSSVRHSNRTRTSHRQKVNNWYGWVFTIKERKYELRNASIIDRDKVQTTNRGLKSLTSRLWCQDLEFTAQFLQIGYFSLSNPGTGQNVLARYVSFSLDSDVIYL